MVNESVLNDKDVLDVQQRLETLTNELKKNACILPRTIQWNYHISHIRNQRSLEKDYQTIRLKKIEHINKVIEITANYQIINFNILLCRQGYYLFALRHLLI